MEYRHVLNELTKSMVRKVFFFFLIVTTGYKSDFSKNECHDPLAKLASFSAINVKSTCIA